MYVRGSHATSAPRRVHIRPRPAYVAGTLRLPGAPETRCALEGHGGLPETRRLAPPANQARRRSRQGGQGASEGGREGPLYFC